MSELITASAETTALAATDPGAPSASYYAWSRESAEFDTPTERHTWPSACLRAGLLALCASVIAGVVSVVGWATAPRHSDTSIPATRDHRPSRAATRVAAPRSHGAPVPLAAPTPVPSIPVVPSPTVRIDASPPVATEVPPPPPASKPPPVPLFEDSQDQWLLNNLRSLGYTIVNPALVISNAHGACRLLQQGESTDQMNQQMQARMGASMLDTLQLTSSAMLAYPNCY
jgi:hypothetical protein